MLRKLVQTARRRLVLNEALKQFALSAALAIGGLALLLTLGTRYLEWWAVALFAVGVTAWAVARLRKRLPSDYAAAVWLDEKSGLHDSLSTAHYFSTRSQSDPKTEALLLAQRGQAESMAQSVDVAIAVPFRFPKALYGLAALLLVSTGLVTVRYFYGHGLDLSAPITEVIFQDLAAAKPPAGAKPPRMSDKKEEYDEARSLLSKLGLDANLEEKSDQKLDDALADALKAADKTPSPDENAKADPTMQKGDPLEQTKGDPKTNPGPLPNEPNPQKAGESKESQNNQAGGQSGEKSEKSLLSKLKDAMDNMMNTPSPQSEKKSGNDKQLSKAPGKPDSSPNAEQAVDNDNQTPADGDPNGPAQKSNSPTQMSGKSGSDKQEGPSAAGSEEGEKAIKAAAQSKAMGKISELIGKRSEQVTGESMVEVQSGNQHLQTTYKDKTATHGEGAGEVSRDQIPLSVQAYVQEYFQQVRKPETAPASPKKPAAAKAVKP